MRRLRVLYAGSPLASAMVLKKLLAASEAHGYEICGVLTNPPSSRGRHKELIPTEVAQAAEAAGLPVYAFDRLRTEAREALAPLGADLLVSFDYGRIFGPKFLALFPLGGVNLHPSALPRYRGCTPVPAAILTGDGELGVCLQKLALETDTGDILARASLPLTGQETTRSLMDGDGLSSPVTDCGWALIDGLLGSMVQAAAGSAPDEADTAAPCPFALPAGSPQAGEASYTPFIAKEDGRIDWKQPAAAIHRKIRAYTPWPLCYTSANGTNLLILQAQVGSGRTDAAPGTVLPYRKAVGVEIACGDGNIIVASELQWQSKKAMDYKSFMNGARNFIGSTLE